MVQANLEGLPRYTDFRLMRRDFEQVNGSLGSALVRRVDHLLKLMRLQHAYRPTGRNALVEDHYAELGFSFDGEGDDGETRWSLSTATSIDAQWFEVARLYPALNVAA